jgi:CBS domain-containing protein
MRVEKLMTKQVTSCGSGDTLERAAQLMWDGDCGWLPVCADNGGNHVVGVITDRDICMSAMFQARPLRELRVSDAMAKQLLTCKPTDSIVDVERTLRDARVRRLPVIDDKGMLVGIIALADIAREAGRDSSAEKPEVTESEVVGTLAAICGPAVPRLAA